MPKAFPKEFRRDVIAMANEVLANGKNSEILALANAVVSGQSAEIKTLKPLAG